MPEKSLFSKKKRIRQKIKSSYPIFTAIEKQEKEII